MRNTINTILIFGSISASIFILFELNKLSLWNSGDASGVFLILSGLLFIFIGFLITRLLNPGRSSQPAPLSKNAKLSKKEHQVLCLITDGRSNGEIAEQLFISESTVKTHVSNILIKLNAKRRTEAVKIGRELKLV